MIKGLVFETTWGTRKTEGDLIGNPIDQLEWVIRQQNYDKDFHDITSAIKTSGVGSFDSIDLDELRTIESCRELLSESEMTTDVLIKSLCKEFFLIHYQDNMGQECIEYIFKPRVSTFDIIYREHFDASDITPPSKRNIYVEPVINYAYDYATERYTKTARVTGIVNNTSWNAALTPGFTAADGEAIWNKCKSLYNRYGIYEPMPQELQDKKWIVNYADAYWWLNRFYGLEMSGFMDWSRITIDLGYYDAIYTKQLTIGKIGTINFPHQTGGADVLCMVEGITEKKDQKICTADLILLSDNYEQPESTINVWQDNDDTGEIIQANDDTGEIIQENS